MKKQAKFQKLMRQALLDAGAEEGEFYLGYRFRIDTQAGPLLLTMHESDLEDKRCDKFTCYALFARFKDPSRGKEAVWNSNPYSGKWNFLMRARGLDPKDAVASVISSIARVVSS